MKLINVTKELKKNSSQITSNVLKLFLFLICSLLVSTIFSLIGFNESNIILTFMIGVLFTARFTDGFIYGILSSLLAVMAFNFFFTEPIFTFSVYRSDYPITFLIMLLTTIIISTLTSRIQRAIKQSLMREHQIQLLYENNKKLLLARNEAQIIDCCGIGLMEILNRNIAISLLTKEKKLSPPQIYTFKEHPYTMLFNSPESLKMMNSIIESNSLGISTLERSNFPAYYYPIKGKSAILGILGVHLSNHEPLEENELMFLKSVSTQVAVALEREKIIEQKKQANIETERERLRGNLLRSISHDLRTPLTSILGSTSTIIENDDRLDSKTRIELLQNIYEETSWLTHSIENILSMTKIDEGRLEIKKNLELFDEIVTESITRIKRLHHQRVFNLEIPDEMIFVNVDGLLIETVLINLIDNAIRYTPSDSPITLKVEKTSSKLIVQVIDNGPGINPDELELIFDRFYTQIKNNFIDKKGIGLGLAICKSIILDHGGTIRAYNNAHQGATFEFTIPMGDEYNGN